MRLSRPGFAVALVAALCLSLPGVASASEIIVRRDSGLSAAERADVRADAGVRLERMLPLRDTELVTVPAAREDRALAALNADADVRYAAANVRLRAAAVPNDEHYAEQWALGAIDVEDAWSGSAQGAGAKVAIVDTQVDTAHEDLAQNVAPRSARDFVSGGCSAAPPTGLADHGTHVAGTVAARSNNLVGIAGVAPDAEIVPVRALDNCGAGTLFDIIAAFEYAAGESGARVVTGSFATDPLMAPAKRAGISEAFATVFEEHRSTLFVVAAGNEGNDNDVLPVYPCNAREPATENLICVGATRRDGAPVCWGNTGGQSVDLFAPGLQIVSTVRGDEYLSMGGTSTAAAIVAGVGALVASDFESGFGIKNALIEGRDVVPGLEADSVSGGRVNAAGAVAGESASAPAVAPWASCDHDHDTFLDSADNCPQVANAGQEDADGDAIGDACDPTPRGPDVDGDAKGLLDDRCPTQPAATADGCPIVITPPGPNPPATPIATPPATPPSVVAPLRIVSLRTSVTPRRCVRGKTCRKRAKLTVRLSRTGTVVLAVERRVRSRGRWVYKRVTRRSITATASGRSATVSRLVKGSYRVTATLATGGRAIKTFRV